VKRIYVNHAGTSWPKPDPVAAATQAAFAADPADWDRAFETAHRAVGSFFGLDTPDSLLLTPGCTSALALALGDFPWSEGDELAIASFEHVAVERPAAALRRRGVSVIVVPPTASEPLDLDALEAQLRRGRVKLVALSAVTNTTGDVLPLDAVIELSHRFGARVLVDAAQAVGWLDLRFDALQADLVAFGGHKGLQGPWGIGGLYVKPDLRLGAHRLDGEAGRSGYCDGGSVDRIALAGLAAAVAWLEEPEQRDRLARARRAAARLEVGLREHAGFRVVAVRPGTERLPTVAVAPRDGSVPRLARRLDAAGIIAGKGLQCAALAHRTLGTSPDGTIRFSFGPKSELDEAEAILDALESS